ncbi:MAG: hypothetical protein ACLQU3_23215 [Limisphaerales bacterium]
MDYNNTPNLTLLGVPLAGLAQLGQKVHEQDDYFSHYQTGSAALSSKARTAAATLLGNSPRTRAWRLAEIACDNA